MNTDSGDADLVAAMRDVYDRVCGAVESFEADDRVGADLA